MHSPNLADDTVTVLYVPPPNPERWYLHMTLALAVQTTEGIILAADGRLSSAELGGVAILNETTKKLHGFGRYAVAMAGFSGLTDAWLRDFGAGKGGLAPLASYPSVHAARDALEAYARSSMRKFRDGPAPSGSILLAGFTDDGAPETYSIHTAAAYQPAAFGHVGSPRGCIAAELARVLFAPGSMEPWRAKVFAAAAIGLAHRADAAVGDLFQVASLTTERGFEDISAEIPAICAEAETAMSRARAAFHSR